MDLLTLKLKAREDAFELERKRSRDVCARDRVSRLSKAVQGCKMSAEQQADIEAGIAELGLTSNKHADGSSASSRGA